MKILFLVLFLSIKTLVCAQNSERLDSTIAFLKEKGIQLNTVTPPTGFTVYYNCDSLLFLRGDFGDTIKIWTSASDWYQNLKQFSEIVKNGQFGNTQFAKSIDDDGRVYVSSYHQTTFIYRNDSLYEIGNSSPSPSGPLSSLFSAYYITKEIDEATYKTQLDGLHQIEEKQATYTPKLIFAKGMFQYKKKVSLPRKLNFEGDTIELEGQWIENGKKCYAIRINNKTKDGQETSYAYSIDEDMRFIQWQGCNRR